MDMHVLEYDPLATLIRMYSSFYLFIFVQIVVSHLFPTFNFLSITNSLLTALYFFLVFIASNSLPKILLIGRLKVCINNQMIMHQRMRALCSHQESGVGATFIPFTLIFSSINSINGVIKAFIYE